MITRLSILLFPVLVVFVSGAEPSALSSPLGEAVRSFAESTPGPSVQPAPTPAMTGEQAEIARLEALPPGSTPVQDAPLASALQLIAMSAGMNFVAPNPSDFSDTVTLSAKINPWRLLQILAERYHFTMSCREGVWLFMREDSSQCLSRSYALRHTNLDIYKASQNSFNLLSAESANAGASSQSGGAAGGMVFTPQTQKILDDLREIVGASATAVTTQETGANAGAARVQSPGSNGGAQRGSVLYLPDSNSLFVTATSQQHERVLEYLKIVDRPVRQIRIEARFFETTHDPKLVLGIDPSGFQPGVSLSNIQTTLDLGRVRATPYPDKVLLAMDSLKLQIQALQSDEKSKLVNNPTVVVANNREAYFSVGDEEPFVSSNSISPGSLDGGFGSTQAHVAIRRIGTSVNLVPTLFPGEQGAIPRIRLSVRIEVGVLKGFRRLNTVDVPVVSSQKYEYTVFLKAGETLAFGGLSGVVESDSVRKVPLAGDVPLLGSLFKSREKRASQRNLVAYLTASVVEDGVPAPAPEAVAKEGAL